MWTKDQRDCSRNMASQRAESDPLSDSSPKSLESDEISSVNSDTSSESDFEQFTGGETEELGARPYMFEPEVGGTDGELGEDRGGSESDSDTERNERLGNNNW